MIKNELGRIYKTPNVSNANNVRNVSTSGGNDNNNANNSNGCAPDLSDSQFKVTDR